MGKVVKKVAGTAGGLLFGKKQTQAADPIAGQLFATQEAASKAQQSGLGALTKRFGEDPGNLVRSRIAAEERQLQGGKEDVVRRAQALVAQRGLGNTSAGLSAILGAEGDINRQIAATRARAPLLVDELKRQRIQDLLGAGTGVVGSQQLPVNLRAQTARGPGLAPLLGAGIGGLLGGPGGASAGLGVGKSLSGLFG
jgi:hypothetical protein